MDPNEVKYFVSNRLPQSRGSSLKWMLWVAFSRSPIEHCFRQAKDELGMDHFEVRGWRCIHRHLYITQLSHLFCTREHQRLRKKTTETAYLTVEQIRYAASVWFDAHCLPGGARWKRYQEAAERIAYHQRHNRDARRSHTKKTPLRYQAPRPAILQTPGPLGYVAL
jgi:SRSO17 transposase